MLVFGRVLQYIVVCIFANGAISDPSRFMVFCETMAWGGVGWGGDVNIL